MGKSRKNNSNKLERDDLEAALSVLDPEERRWILGQADKIADEIKTRTGGKIMFGKLSALELIAIAGIYAIKNDLKNFHLPKRLKKEGQ